MEDVLLNISTKMIAKLTVQRVSTSFLYIVLSTCMNLKGFLRKTDKLLYFLQQLNARSRDMRRQKIIKECFFKSMVQCHWEFQDPFKKGIELVPREEGKEKIKVGDSEMVMEGIREELECKVEMTEEDKMMVKVAHLLILNKEEMKGVKVGFKVESIEEHKIAVKEVHVVEIGVAKAKALGEVEEVEEEKKTVVETVENKMNQLVDVVVKTKTNEGIQRGIVMNRIL